MAKKQKVCTSCKLERLLTFTANLYFADNGMIIGLKRICIPCFMQYLKIHEEPGKYDHKKAYMCLKDLDTQAV